MHIAAGGARRSGDLRRRLDPLGLESGRRCRRDKVAALAADIDQPRPAVKAADQQSTDVREAGPGMARAPLRGLRIGQVEAGIVERPHRAQIIRLFDLAHQLTAGITAQQRSFRQHDVGGCKRRGAADRAGVDIPSGHFC